MWLQMVARCLQPLYLSTDGKVTFTAANITADGKVYFAIKTGTFDGNYGSGLTLDNVSLRKTQ